MWGGGQKLEQKTENMITLYACEVYDFEYNERARLNEHKEAVHMNADESNLTTARKHLLVKIVISMLLMKKY